MKKETLILFGKIAAVALVVVIAYDYFKKQQADKKSVAVVIPEAAVVESATV